MPKTRAVCNAAATMNTGLSGWACATIDAASDCEDVKFDAISTEDQLWRIDQLNKKC